MAPAFRWVVGLGSTATLLVGCALIVGDPVGHRVFDAGTSEPVREDSGKPSGDAKAADAGIDASALDATHGIDATTLDGSFFDAADAGALDAGTDAHFCATFTPPAGTTAYCEDFDENQDATSFGAIQVFPGGTLAVQHMQAKSPPNSLLATASPPRVDGSTELTLASLETQLGSGTSYTLEADVMLSPIPDGPGFDDIGGLLFGAAGSGSGIAIEVYGPTPDGRTPIAMVEASPGASKTHPPVSVALHGWFHLVLNVTNIGSGFVDSFTINGQVLEANYKLASTFTDTMPAAYIGWSFASVAGEVTAYFDNVVVMWK
jgi:hypothetical protein